MKKLIVTILAAAAFAGFNGCATKEYRYNSNGGKVFDHRVGDGRWEDRLNAEIQDERDLVKKMEASNEAPGWRLAMARDHLRYLESEDRLQSARFNDYMTRKIQHPTFGEELEWASQAPIVDVRIVNW
jgi:hypothetical protein